MNNFILSIEQIDLDAANEHKFTGSQNCPIAKAWQRQTNTPCSVGKDDILFHEREYHLLTLARS